MKLVVVVMMSLLLFGCGKEQDKLVVSYCKAIEAGKLDQAVSFLSKDAKQVLERSGGKSLLTASVSEFKQRKGIKGIDITKSTVAGDKATVELLYRFNDGSTVKDSYPLVRENSVWKISN